MTTQLGKYRLDGTLGSGSMGVVYRAFDLRIQRPVALKTIRSDLLGGEAWEALLARFQREAMAAGRLLHPNIVTVFDFGVEDEVAYIAMELVEGTSLKAVMADQTAPDLALAVHWTGQLLRALEFAHEAGVIHRDIKPANLMVTRAQRIKVADFGVARIDDGNATQSGIVVGTLNYMAPEQYASDRCDGRADLYSAGVVLYELLCGRRPFKRSAQDDGAGFPAEPPAPPSTFHPAVPPALDQVVLRALEYQAEQRFATAVEFRQALEAAARALPASVTGLAADEDAAPRPAARNPVPNPAVAPATAPAGPWQPAFLEALTRLLTLHVGPIAPTLVRRSSRDLADPDGLRARLADCISSLEGKAAFNAAFAELLRHQAEASGSTPAAPPSPSGVPAGAGPGTDGAPAASLSAGAVSEIEDVLTRYTGPIARVLVRKIANAALDRREFCRRLAEHISDPGQRSRFLDESLDPGHAAPRA